MLETMSTSNRKHQSKKPKLPEFRWNELTGDIEEEVNDDNKKDDQIIVIDSDSDDDQQQLRNELNQICPIEIDGIISNLESEMNAKSELESISKINLTDDNEEELKSTLDVLGLDETLDESIVIKIKANC